MQFGGGWRHWVVHCAPVLLDMARRPHHEDRRDLHQRTIIGFFVPSPDQSGSSSGFMVSDSNRGKGANDPFSMLCWGLWCHSVKHGDETREVKNILNYHLKEDAEPLACAEVFCRDSKKLCYRRFIQVQILLQSLLEWWGI